MAKFIVISKNYVPAEYLYTYTRCNTEYVRVRFSNREYRGRSFECSILMKNVISIKKVDGKYKRKLRLWWREVWDGVSWWWRYSRVGKKLRILKENLTGKY